MFPVNIIADFSSNGASHIYLQTQATQQLGLSGHGDTYNFTMSKCVH